MQDLHLFGQVHSYDMYWKMDNLKAVVGACLGSPLRIVGNELHTMPGRTRRPVWALTRDRFHEVSAGHQRATGYDG